MGPFREPFNMFHLELSLIISTVTQWIVHKIHRVQLPVARVRTRIYHIVIIIRIFICYVLYLFIIDTHYDVQVSGIRHGLVIFQNTFVVR